MSPNNTAVRVARRRALPVEVDDPPHVIVDEIGPQIAALDAGWHERREMNPW